MPLALVLTAFGAVDAVAMEAGARWSGGEGKAVLNGVCLGLNAQSQGLALGFALGLPWGLSTGGGQGRSLTGA